MSKTNDGKIRRIYKNKSLERQMKNNNIIFRKGLFKVE